MSGKGSAPRPLSISNEEYAKRWDAIFQRDLKEEEDDKAWVEEFELTQKRTVINSREDALERLARTNDELGLSIEDTYNPLVK